MTTKPTSRPAHKRRKKLVKPRVQLRMVAVSLGCVALSALLVTLLVGREVAALAHQLPSEGDILMGMLPGTLMRALLWALVLVTPTMVGAGILATFRFVGPAYRFERYLEGVLDGSESGPCRIRSGDELQELCDLITRVTEPVRERADGAAEVERSAA